MKTEGLNFDDSGPFVGMDLSKMPWQLVKPHVRLLKKFLHGLGA